MISEVSRLSQLSSDKLTVLSAGMAEHGLMFSAITAEIRDAINGLSEDKIEPAAEWYRNANGFALELAGTYDVSVEIAAGVISAVSPRMPWLRNKNVAREILKSFRNYSHLSAEDAAKEMSLGLNVNIAMAIKIARGESISDTLTGTKRRSFYNNIVSPIKGDSVTVDTWMVRAIMNTTGFSLKFASDLLRINRTTLKGTGVGYFVIAEAVRNVAKEMMLRPSQIQALYWVAISGSVDGGREDIG